MSFRQTKRAMFLVAACAVGATVLSGQAIAEESARGDVAIDAACGPVPPFTCRASNEKQVEGYPLRVGFADKWSDIGVSEWRISSSITTSNYGKKNPISLTDNYCFNKYGFGGITLTGPGLTAGSEQGCGSRTGSAKGNVLNRGEVIGRGNRYGRWISFGHEATARVTVGSSNYFVSAYKRSSPNGGDA